MPDVDRRGYQIRNGISWETGIIIVDDNRSNSTEWSPPSSATYNFWIKAFDRTFLESSNATGNSITIDLEDSLNYVVDREEIPIYVPDATLYNFFYNTTTNTVIWTPGATDTDFEDRVDTSLDVSTYVGDTDSGTYTSDIIDIGTFTTFSIRLNSDYTTILINPTDTDLTDNRTDITYPIDTDTSITSISKVLNEYRYSDDNITYSEWVPWTNVAQLTTRYIQVRVTTQIDISATFMELESIHTIFDVPDKVKKIK